MKKIKLLLTALPFLCVSIYGYASSVAIINIQNNTKNSVIDVGSLNTPDGINVNIIGGNDNGTLSPGQGLTAVVNVSCGKYCSNSTYSRTFPVVNSSGVQFGGITISAVLWEPDTTTIAYNSNSNMFQANWGSEGNVFNPIFGNMLNYGLCITDQGSSACG